MYLGCCNGLWKDQFAFQPSTSMPLWQYHGIILASMDVQRMLTEILLEAIERTMWELSRAWVCIDDFNQIMFPGEKMRKTNAYV